MKYGDLEARNKIVCHNLWLVRNVVMNGFSNTLYDFDELVSIGQIGLIKSVDTFDIDKKYAFSTYASKCIRNEILMFMKKDNKYINNKSLNSPLGNSKDGKELTVEDTLCDINSDFVAKYEESESYKVIREVVERLPEINKYIITKYFGFIDDQMTSQEEIAQELGLSQSYISKIIKITVKDISVQLKKLGIIEVPRKVKKIK